MTALRTIACSLVIALIGCGEDPNSIGTAIGDIEFTRADGTIDFEEHTHIWRGPWQWDIPVDCLHILVGLPDPGRPDRAYWRVWVVLDDVVAGQEITFPNRFTWNKPREVSIFVLDGQNELSTAEEGASGSIVFRKLDCTSAGEIEFEIAATLGSEYHLGPVVDVGGRFRGVASAPPQ